MKRQCLFVPLLLLIAFGASPPQRAERRPLQRPVLRLESTFTTKRYVGIDPRTGEGRYEAHQGKVTLDEKTGNYLITWIGTDGKLKTIVFEPSIKVDVIVEAHVQYEEARRKFRYSYKLRNLKSSQQKLYSFILQTKAPLYRIMLPDEGWIFGPMHGFKVQEGVWMDWADVKHDRLGIPPGQEIEDISFESSGLPGIVGCYVRGYAEPMRGVGEDGMPEEIADTVYDASFKWPYGRTIGPVAPPEPFQPREFLQSLMAMLEESLSLGWIDRVETVNFFKSKLAKAEQAMRSKDYALTKSALREVIEEAEKLKETKITSEVYAILRFNAQYLIEKQE